MSLLDQLNEMRRFGGAIRTHGLADAQVTQLAAKYPELVEAIAEASVSHRSLRTEMPELLALDENAQLARVQGDFINFYPEDAINPYVALAARGPWVVTLKGAVIHDSGGYGMLGFGHTPKAILAALGKAQVMANVMTPNVSQLRFTRALQREIGHSRGGSPFKHFLCLNS